MRDRVTFFTLTKKILWVTGLVGVLNAFHVRAQNSFEDREAFFDDGRPTDIVQADRRFHVFKTRSGSQKDFVSIHYGSGVFFAVRDQYYLIANSHTLYHTQDSSYYNHAWNGMIDQGKYSLELVAVDAGMEAALLRFKNSKAIGREARARLKELGVVEKVPGIEMFRSSYITRRGLVDGSRPNSVDVLGYPFDRATGGPLGETDLPIFPDWSDQGQLTGIEPRGFFPLLPFTVRVTGAPVELGNSGGPVFSESKLEAFVSHVYLDTRLHKEDSAKQRSIPREKGSHVSSQTPNLARLILGVPALYVQEWVKEVLWAEYQGKSFIPRYVLDVESQFSGNEVLYSYGDRFEMKIDLIDIPNELETGSPATFKTGGLFGVGGGDAGGVGGGDAGGVGGGDAGGVGGGDDDDERTSFGQDKTDQVRKHIGDRRLRQACYSLGEIKSFVSKGSRNGQRLTSEVSEDFSRRAHYSVEVRGRGARFGREDLIIETYSKDKRHERKDHRIQKFITEDLKRFVRSDDFIVRIPFFVSLNSDGISENGNLLNSDPYQLLKRHCFRNFAEFFALLDDEALRPVVEVVKNNVIRDDQDRLEVEKKVKEIGRDIQKYQDVLSQQVQLLFEDGSAGEIRHVLTAGSQQSYDEFFKRLNTLGIVLESSWLWLVLEEKTIEQFRDVKHWEVLAMSSYGSLQAYVNLIQRKIREVEVHLNSLRFAKNSEQENQR